MDMMLAELEREFRENWSGFRPASYDPYLQQVEEELRTDLLIRMLCAEIEFSYQPPVALRNDSSLVPLEDVDDQRVRPTLRLFLLQFPELRSRVDGIIQLSVLEYALRIRYDTKPPNIASYLELCETEQERLGGLLQLTEYRIADSRADNEQSSLPIKSGDSTEPETNTEKPVVLDRLPCNLGNYYLKKQ